MSPPDLGRSIGHRIRNRASDLGIDPARLRRHLVFQRILARLAPSGQWILKGGFSLEVRFDLKGRATKDLDIVSVQRAASALDLQDALADLLEVDTGDSFGFVVELPKALPARDDVAPGWRVKVRALVDGAHFEYVLLDVVAAGAEVEGAVQPLLVEPPVQDPALSSVTVPAVDLPQHAAEKVHAYSRIYANDRPSSRVKDLIDLVLMIEAGLLAPSAWAGRCQVVYDVRDAEDPPEVLPSPPESWREPYAAMAAELQLTAATIEAAYDLLATYYAAAFPTLGYDDKDIDGPQQED